MKLKIGLLILSINVFAQQTPDTESGINITRKSFSIGIGGNIGFGTEDFTKAHESQTETYYYYNNGSWGKGIDISLNYNYKIHPNIGLGINAGIFTGTKTSIDNQYYNDSTQTIIKEEFSYKANYIKISPFVLFDAFVSRNNAFYAKIGYVLGSGKMKTTFEDAFNGPSGKFGATIKREITGGMIHGTQFALGFRAKVGTDVSFFTELNVNTLTQKVKEDNMVSATSQGSSILQYFDTYNTKTIFVDEIKVADANSSPDLSKPRESLSYNAIYNSIGLQVGLCFHLR
jgi:hypothetical protein